MIVHQSAQSFHDVDPTPAGYPLGQPDQRLRTASQAVECPRCKRAEGAGEQSGGLDLRDVLRRADDGEQGKADIDLARVSSALRTAPAMCSLWWIGT